MSVREIITNDRAALSVPSLSVAIFDATLRKLLGDLADTLEAHDGFGLAAPQVGVRERCCVLALPPDTKQWGAARVGEQVLVGLVPIVNPVIVWHGRVRAVADEGCLSFPGQRIPIRRYVAVRVQANMTDGTPFEILASGEVARAFQHEIDHFDGKTIFDRQDPRFRPRLRGED